MGTITRNFANNVLTNGTIDATDGLTGVVPASNINNDSIGNVTAFAASIGDFVETVSSDVAASAGTEGQLFYNSTSGKLKGIQNIGGAISSGGNLNTARRVLTGAGTQTAGLAIAGKSVPGPSVANVEEYDGSTWTNATAIPTATQEMGSAGTQVSGLAFGGQVVPPFAVIQNATYEYDGSSWTSGGNLGTGRYNITGCGTQTAALGSTGITVNPSPPPNFKGRNLVEEYDGSAWTSGGAYPIEASGVRTAGTQTSALAAGGAQFGAWIITSSNEYDGSTWTAGGNLSQENNNGGISGIQTAAIYAGGFGGPSAPTSVTRDRIEIYNGTSWTTQPATLTVARSELASSQQGPTTQTMFFGGPGTTTGALTEEWNDPTYSVQTLTTS